jgi:hypothetical protein
VAPTAQNRASGVRVGGSLIVVRDYGHSGSKLVAELLALSGAFVLFEPNDHKCALIPLASQLTRLCGCAHGSVGSVYQQLCRDGTCALAVAPSCTTALVGNAGLAKRIPEAPVIRLVRTNMVKHALSTLQLWHNHATKANESVRTPRTVNTRALLCAVRRIARAVHKDGGSAGKFAREGEPTLIYERLQTDPLDELRQVQRFPNVTLQIGAANVSMHKTTTDDLRAAVRNFDEVHDALGPWACLQRMWTSTSPEVFGACDVTTVPCDNATNNRIDASFSRRTPTVRSPDARGAGGARGAHAPNGSAIAPAFIACAGSRCTHTNLNT